MALICHCEGVRDRTIVKAINRGASTLAEVQAACGAATRCGGCEPAVHELLERHAAAHAHGHAHAQVHARVHGRSEGAAVTVNVRPAFGLSA